MLRYDVIVVGAGLTGSSIFRDCALRGLSVLLIETDDVGTLEDRRLGPKGEPGLASLEARAAVPGVGSGRRRSAV